jgi:hypothetical protein
VSGILGQIGWKSEASWNTLAVPDTFAALLSEEITNDGGEVIQSNGIRAGRRIRNAHKRGAPLIGGTVSQELGNADIADLLLHIFGAVSTTGAAAPYTHTYTVGNLNDKSLTTQVGRPSIDGVVHARTFGGVKIPSAEITAAASENAQLNATVSAASETGAEALAAASYTAAWEPFVYTEGAVTIGGTAVTVDSFSISIENALRTDRKAIGSPTITKQLGNGLRDITISLEMDFESLEMYNHFLNDDALTLVLALDNGTDSFTVTAKGYLSGSSPTLSGPEILKQPVEFVAESDVSDADAFQAVLVNSEATAA